MYSTLLILWEESKSEDRDVKLPADDVVFDEYCGTRFQWADVTVARPAKDRRVMYFMVNSVLMLFEMR